MSILQTLEEYNIFHNVLSLIQNSGKEKLYTKGNLTLFAPTDDAFLKTPQSKRARLLGMEPSTLLKYHTLGVPLQTYEMPINVPTLLQEAPCLFVINSQPQTRIGSALNGNGAYVIQSIECKNGIIHVLDRPLDPPVPINMCYIDY